MISITACAAPVETVGYEALAAEQAETERLEMLELQRQRRIARNARRDAFELQQQDYILGFQLGATDARFFSELEVGDDISIQVEIQTHTNLPERLSSAVTELNPDTNMVFVVVSGVIDRQGLRTSYLTDIGIFLGAQAQIRRDVLDLSAELVYISPTQ